MTVQVVTAPELTLAGLQVRLDTCPWAIRLTVVVCEVLFKAAVMLTLWFVVVEPAVAMKVAELAPGSTTIDAGIVSRKFVSDNAMVAPPGAP